ncbi:MAG: hypothetical protein P8177_08130 [Gemmatimonadota bacterium]
MKKHAILAALVLAVFGLAACDEESTGVEDDTEELVGTWVSKGADLAPGFAPFAIDSIIATFNEDQTYEVLQYAGGSDQEVTLTGTYVIGPQEEGEIRAITLTQATPSALTAAGIFQVSGSSMQYEVIQVQPDIGATAPTVSGGFGSTTVGGSTTSVWIQGYDWVSTP